MMKALAVALTALVAGTAAVAPADLLVAEDVPAGLFQASEPPINLAFSEYGPLSPDATAHVDPDGSGALSMRAAVDVWTSDDDDVLLREVTLWADEADARAFVEQAVVVGVQDDLDRAEPPFDGAVAFIGADDGLWTRTAAWQQGPYAMTIAHFGVFEGSDRIIDETTTALAQRVADETGHEVAIVETDTPDVTSESESGGGIGIGTVLLWILVIAGVTWLIMRLRRRAAGNERERGRPSDRGDQKRPDADDRAGADGPADVDDIIERARARGRAEREIEAIPDPSEPGWTPPDDS